MNMCIFVNEQIVFIALGVSHGLFYGICGNQIFDFNADPGQENSVKAKAKNIKEAPLPWKIEHFLHRFLGAFFGWLILWVLLDLRMNLFEEPRIDNLSVGDLVLFLLAWVGINGRLPSIAHSIDRWLEYPVKSLNT